MTKIVVNAAGGAALSDLQSRILAHCAASCGLRDESLAVTPHGIVAPSVEAVRSIYGELVYGYGIDIFTAFVTDKITRRKYDAIADFVDSFATQLEYAVGLKKGDLAQGVTIQISA